MAFVVSPEAMRQYDVRCIKREKISAYELMERAGSALADAIVDGGHMNTVRPSRVLVVSGPGNNGGDGLVVGRILAERGADVTCAIIKGDDATDENRRAQSALSKSAASVVTLDSDSAMQRLFETTYDLIIDALFGLGLDRVPEGLFANAIRQMNASTATRVALDIPSGLHGGTGLAFVPCVHAHVTLVVEAFKHGNLMHDARDVSGDIILVSIGIDCTGSKERFITSESLHNQVPLRRHHSHKYHHGTVQIVGGAYEMPGAPALTARAAYAVGAGLVILSTSSSVRAVLRDIPSEAIHATIPEHGTPVMDRADAYVIGPGLLNSPANEVTMEAMLARPTPMVIDGGALRMFHERFMMAPDKPVVLTPHAGEMASLCQLSTKDFTQNWHHHVSQYATQHGVYVLYKGPCSVLVSPDGTIRYMLSGNPALAKAGSGDVLAGIIGTFLAQGMPAKTAVPLAVYIHGHAADLAAQAHGELSVMAHDVIRLLSDALKPFVTQKERATISIR